MDCTTLRLVMISMGTDSPKTSGPGIALPVRKCQKCSRQGALTMQGQQEAVGPRRIDLLYLLDSALQAAVRREGRVGTPAAVTSRTLPRALAAALPRLVGASASSAEGASKTLRVCYNACTVVLSLDLFPKELRTEDLAGYAGVIC